jgi:N-acetylmuramoyl-L-alanine amidase
MKIIALDAGHGYNTLGKRCMKSLDPDQTREWWLNDRIMDIVEKRLKAEYECNVLRVDDTTGAKDVSLYSRVKAANDAKADVYVSMHHNAGLNGRNGGGTVVYYYSTNAKRREQAQRLYNFIADETKLYGNRCEQVIKKAFFVIKNTKMPAFLVENGFMDSPTDVPRILSPEHAQKTAEGVVVFLAKEFSLEPKKAVEKPNTEAYYPAYKGVKATLSVALKSLGIDYSYAFRQRIAEANSISGYRGTAAQNTHMYNLLVAGLLKRV